MKGNRERAPLYGKDFPVRFEPPRQVQQGRFFFYSGQKNVKM